MPERPTILAPEAVGHCPWPGFADRRRARLLVVLSAGLLVVVVLVGWMVRTGGPLADPDQQLVTDIHAWIAGATGFVRGVKAITLLGDPLTLYLAVGLGIGLAWRRGRTRPCLFVALTAFTAAVANSLLKALVDRPRPVVDDLLASASGRSFPSGHALGATVTYGAILVAVWPLLSPRAQRWAVAVVVVLVTAVGASRVLLGVHHLSDVVAGHCLALAWLCGALALGSRGRSGTPAGPPTPSSSSPPATPPASTRRSSWWPVRTTWT